MINKELIKLLETFEQNTVNDNVSKKLDDNHKILHQILENEFGIVNQNNDKHSIFFSKVLAKLSGKDLANLAKLWLKEINQNSKGIPPQKPTD